MTAALDPNPPQFPFGNRWEEPLTPRYESDQDGIRRVELPTGRLAWLVTRHDDVRQMLRSPDFSADWTKPGYPLLRPLLMPDESRQYGMFIRMDGMDHARLRRMLTAEFMIKNVRALSPLIHQTVVSALDAMRALGAPADLIAHFALPVPSMVICHLLGVPYVDHEFFQERSRTLLAWSTPPEAAEVARDELRDYLYELIDRRLRDPGDDLVSRLAVERLATGEITKTELAGMALLLLIAGHETTANMIGLSTIVLLRHPEHVRKLRQTPELIDDTVEELLRYLTIVRTGLLRVAAADTEIAGHAIRAGEGVIALVSVANQDHAVFGDAAEFDPRPASRQHMAFGFGVHQCLGQPLARAELRTALIELITRFPELALAIDPTEVEFRDSAIFGAHRLPVTW